MDLDAWRTARSRDGRAEFSDCRAEFSTDFGVYWDPATSRRL